MNFSLAVQKKLSKLFSAGINVSFYSFKHDQLRDVGLTDNYPFKLGRYPNGIHIYETFTYKDNFILLGPIFTFHPLKNIALYVNPCYTSKESSRLEAAFTIQIASNSSTFQKINYSNPDSKNTGFLLKGGLLFYPHEKISFALEYLRILSTINTQSQIEPAEYTAIAVKIGYSFTLLKKNNF